MKWCSMPAHRVEGDHAEGAVVASANISFSRASSSLLRLVETISPCDPLNASATRSTTASLVSVNSADVPGVTLLFTWSMNLSSMPTSVSAPVRAPMPAPIAMPRTGTRKSRPNSIPQNIPPRAPAPTRLLACRVLGCFLSGGQLTTAASCRTMSRCFWRSSRVFRARSAPSTVGNSTAVSVAIASSYGFLRARRKRDAASTRVRERQLVTGQGTASSVQATHLDRTLTAQRQHARERVEVARISGALPREPVLCAPEQVRLEQAGPLHAPVVVLDDVFWQAAGHRPLARIGRGRHDLPR